MHLSRNLMTVMKSSLVGTFFLLLLSRIVSGLGSVVSRHYSYIQKHYTWQEAQSYCRNSDGQGDLATLCSQSDSDALYLENCMDAWIGLYRDWDWQSWVDRWTWIRGGNLNFYPWVNYEPDNGERCGYAYYVVNNQTVGSADCENYYFFICDHTNFVPESKTWHEAKEYCQDKNLAKYNDRDDFERDFKLEDFPVWIGLHRVGNTWKWSADFSDYENWASDEAKSNGDCVSISSHTKKMATQNCSHRFPFICSEDNLVLVKENKTWEEALEYCRALRSSTHPKLHYDLVSVQPEDYNYLRIKVMEANTEEVWTGLRFLAGEWLWMNRADMMYSDLPLCTPMVQLCGTLSKNTGSMETRDCAERRNFLCYWM